MISFKKFIESQEDFANNQFSPHNRNIFPFPLDPHAIQNKKISYPKGTNVRWIIRNDLPRLSEISNKSQEKLYAILQNPNVIGLTLEINGIIEGYIIYKLLKDNIEITHLIVTKGNKKEKTEFLMQKLFDKIDGSTRESLTFTIDESILDYPLVTTWLKQNGFISEYIDRNTIKFIRYNHDYKKHNSWEDN